MPWRRHKNVQAQIRYTNCKLSKPASSGLSDTQLCVLPIFKVYIPSLHSHLPSRHTESKRHSLPFEQSPPKSKVPTLYECFNGFQYNLIFALSGYHTCKVHSKIPCVLFESKAHCFLWTTWTTLIRNKPGKENRFPFRRVDNDSTSDVFFSLCGTSDLNLAIK